MPQAKKRVSLSDEDLLRLLQLANTEKKATKKDEEIIIALVNAHLNNSNVLTLADDTTVKPASLNTVKDQALLKYIIYILSILSGYPESNIGLTTTLHSLGITPMKRETLRRRINKYLSGRGSNKFITSAEMEKCKTVNDVYTTAESKL